MKSNNPFTMLGSYLGLVASMFLFSRGWHLFFWLPPLLGLQIDNFLYLDAVGGFLAGYLIQLFFRLYNYKIEK